LHGLSGGLGESGVSLHKLDNDALRREFERNRDHQQKLEQINEVLKKRNSDQANELQFDVINRLRILRRNGPAPVTAHTHQENDERWVAEFFRARSLRYSDGNPLYRYRMTDAEYVEANKIMRYLAACGKLIPGNRAACMVFVAFCAEWFRREANSTFRKWDDLAPDVFPSIPWNVKTGMTKAGLNHWKRPLLTTDDTSEYLLSLALEGGVPVNAIIDGSKGWLRDYLRTLVRFTSISDDPTKIRGFAHDESYRVKPTYRREQFIDLCAEIAVTLAKWRTVVECETPGGMDAVSYLDARHPTWKDTIPLYISDKEDSTARQLLVGLVTEKFDSVAAQGVGATRHLKLLDGSWHPAIRILAHGELPVGRVPMLPRGTRWKAVPSGALANFLPSQFALFEPPTDEERTWRVRPLTELSKIIVGFPLTARVTANLATSNANHPVEWPGGERVTSDMLVFVEEQPSDSPSQLKLVKTGSASLPAKRLYALVPKDWTAESLTAPGRSWPSSDGMSVLYEIEGTYYFTDAEDGARYRVEADSDEREANLEIHAGGTASIHSSGDLDIFEGPVSVQILDSGTVRDAEPGSIFLRQPGGVWRPLQGREIRAYGCIDVSWRDTKANIQLERKRIAVIPTGAKIHGVLHNNAEGQVTLTNLDNWSLEFLHKNVVKTHDDDDETGFRFDGRPTYRIEASLLPPMGAAIPICISVLARQAAILTSDGSVVSGGQTLDLTALRGSLAISSHRSRMVITRHHSKAQDIVVSVDQEFPMATLKSAIEEIFASLEDQDGEVDIEFLGDFQPPVRLRQYRWERASSVGDTILFSQTSVSDPVAKMVLAPELEHKLDRVDDGTFRLPSDLYGPCLVYSRDGPDVVSRPLVVIGKAPVPSFAPETLQWTSCIPNYIQRKALLDLSFQRLSDGNGNADEIAYLLSIIRNLNGLPAKAFDALNDLWRFPKVLIRLLIKATDDATRQSVWRLQSKLPFIWLSLPLADWKDVLDHERLSLDQTLAQLPIGDDKRTEILVSHFAALNAGLCDIEPALQYLLHEHGFVGQATQIRSLKDAIETFIKDQRMKEDAEDGIPSKPTLNPLAAKVEQQGLRPPSELSRFSANEFDGLFTPLILAASARGLIKIDADLEIPLRISLRESADYVTESYGHFSNFYRNM